MAQSLGHQRMEELLQLNLGITYELLNQLEQAISCHTLVSERYTSPPFLCSSLFSLSVSTWAWWCEGGS